MGVECSYGFKDLYRAAYGEAMGQEIEQRLYSVDQNERNDIVTQWAKDAGWETSSRTGSDGLIYLAFCPSFTPERAQ